MMSLVRLLGFTTLGCGCVTGRYREVATNREIIYVEEKGTTCECTTHRRNHTLAPARFGLGVLTARAS
jgi:3'-phosphoadenosine 5'-phosphosulfate sulfotransferase (PAPS reductase)/FAD synthetase